MQRSNRELWISFFAILAISIVYLFAVIQLDGIPHASDLFGHGIGILGFVLMLMTEVLYSLRKRSRSARWGRMSNWLSFHIFTGLVGPYMVLLHTSWKFNGLAGLVLWMTALVVASGFIGRYIYTAVPRTADGVEIEAAQLEAEIAASDAELQRWAAGQPDGMRSLALQLEDGRPILAAGKVSFILGRAFLDWGERLSWRLEKARLPPLQRRQIDTLEALLGRRRRLQRQLASLAAARRLLALWHSIHIPLGMALFTAAFIHIVAAIYYATLLR